ncbi:hypothetical protein TUM4641_29600 [Shewanella morhuae]|nr:hypothetical protein TUM4641_29600 [Shewanella morhuae]
MGKSKHRITNWPEYNKALVNRGSLTFWIDNSGAAPSIMAAEDRVFSIAIQLSKQR